jgi:hypothetical protein
MSRRRSEIVHELHNAQQALRSREKRERRTIRRLRDIEKALEPVMKTMEFWASQRNLDDDTNAARVMTVGQCRAILALLKESDEDESEDSDESDAA